MPTYVIQALEELFGEPVADIKVIQNSRYAALHGKIWATTRREKILLNMNQNDFACCPELVLHEYYHVVKQWRNGDLTVIKYIIETLKNGYTNNKYEVATNRFVQQNIAQFKSLLNKYKASSETSDQNA